MKQVMFIGNNNSKRRVEMRKAKGLFVVGIILLGAALGIFLAGPAIAQGASDSILVKIQPELKDDKVIGFNIDPQTIHIKQNTIVIWMSGVQEKEVQIVFEEGKTCKDVTANPNLKHPGFFELSKNCYVTSFLPYASTSILQFVEAGEFDYEVVTEDLKMKAKGKIIVTK